MFLKVSFAITNLYTHFLNWLYTVYPAFKYDASIAKILELFDHNPQLFTLFS